MQYKIQFGSPSQNRENRGAAAATPISRNSSRAHAADHIRTNPFLTFFKFFFRPSSVSMSELIILIIILANFDDQLLCFKNMALRSAPSSSLARFSGLQTPVTGSGTYETFSVDPVISSVGFFNIAAALLAPPVARDTAPCDAAEYPLLQMALEIPSATKAEKSLAFEKERAIFLSYMG